jgi:hypothetical protein
MDGFISSKLFFLDLDVRTPPLLKNPMMFKRQQFSTLPICDEKCSKPKIFLVFRSKLLCFSFIL